MKNPVVNVVGIRCQPGQEKKFVKWYDEVHVPMILKFKGMMKATRYEIIKRADAYPEYLGVFEFESEEAFEAYEKSPELAAAQAEMKQTWPNGGWERMWRVQYRSEKKWGK